MAVTYFTGRLAALTRLDLIGSCKCSVAGVAANQRSPFHCFSSRVSLTATNVTRPLTSTYMEEIYQFLYIGPYAYRLRERRRDRSFVLKKKEARGRRRRLLSNNAHIDGPEG